MTEEMSANVGANNHGDRVAVLAEGLDIRGDTGGGNQGMESLGGRDSGGSDEDETGSSNTLSPDDEMRLQQRRERNRLAAARCRDRRRQRAAELVEESDTLESQNDALMADIARLDKEKRMLEGTLRHHLPKCALHRQPNLPLLQVDGQQQLPSHPHDQQHQSYPQQCRQHQLLPQQRMSPVHCHPQPHCQLHPQSHCQPKTSRYQQHQLQSHQYALSLNQRSAEDRESIYSPASTKLSEELLFITGQKME